MGARQSPPVRRNCGRGVWPLQAPLRAPSSAPPMTTDTSALTQLGRHAEPPAGPEQARLERVPNPQADVLYLARFTAPEFTSLCPVTGQPDFAHLVIDYAPGDWLVESKSLKLYLTSFRNHGSFHEDCTLQVARRIVEDGRAPVAAHRRLLVPPRRHPHRRVLADGRRRPRGCGCPTRACRPIAAAAEAAQPSSPNRRCCRPRSMRAVAPQMKRPSQGMA